MFSIDTLIAMLSRAGVKTSIRNERSGAGIFLDVGFGGDGAIVSDELRQMRAVGGVMASKSLSVGIGEFSCHV